MKIKLLVVISALMSSLVAAEVAEQAITFNDDLGSAVLYTDESGDPSVGVVVVHEWWGLNDYAHSRARQLAEAGYAAIAVDMYGHGKVASHAKDAKGFMDAAFADPDKMNARFEAARQALIDQAGIARNRHYGIGYCFGGAVVLNQARAGADLRGVASFHGSLGTENPVGPGKVAARVLVATGGADPMVPAEQVASFVKEMSLAGVDLQLLSFPGAKHSFTNPGADAAGKANELPLAYDAGADAASWDALLRFLQ